MLMFTWILLPIITAFCKSISGFIDNFLVDTYIKKMSGKSIAIIYVSIEAVVCLAMLAGTGGAVLNIGFGEITIFLAAATMNFFGSVPYYRALKNDETTEVSLLTQVTPIITLVLGWVFLREAITPVQLIAFALIVAASFYVVFGSGRKGLKLKKTAAFYMVMACFFWALADIIFVTQARESDFTTSLFWFLTGGVLVNAIAFIIMRPWQRDLRKFLAHAKTKKLAIMTINEAVWFVGQVAWRYALVIMPVAIVSATRFSSQLIVTFVLGIILTAVFPKFGREKLKKRLIINHAVATVMIVMAIILLEVYS